MGRKIDYPKFLESLDAKLAAYFTLHEEYICCKRGCSACCENGEYPVSDIELEYLTQGFMLLDNEIKRQVQQNFKEIRQGGKCPFLVNKECSVYSYRPIICRTHGLAYFMDNGTVNVPYCVNSGKNYKKVYKDDTFFVEPVGENLSTANLLKELGNSFVIKNLYDWVIGQ